MSNYIIGELYTFRCLKILSQNTGSKFLKREREKRKKRKLSLAFKIRTMSKRVEAVEKTEKLQTESKFK